MTAQNYLINATSFPKTELLEISELVPIEIGDARGLLISDSHIITYNNRKEDEIIEVFDRQTSVYKGAFLTKGRSRDEVAVLTRIIQKKEVNGRLELLIQSFPQYMNWLDVDSSLISNKAVFVKRNEFKTKKQKEIITNSGSSYDLGDNILLMRYNLSDNEYPAGCMLLYDVNRDCELNRFSWIEIDKSISQAGILSSGNSAISSDRKKTVFSFFNLNLLTFYNLETKEKRNVLFSEDAMDYEKAERQMIKEDFRPYYLTCIGSTTYFYAVKNPSKRDENITSIIQLFNWDGEPKYEFAFKERILFIDVDEKTKQLYAIIITSKDELKVVIYNLPSSIFEPK